ncbi:MAG: CDP-diacylglycerol--glycerol-3-phosphate 3-phosphatidyltransferase [Halanaerobiales bacterium]
MAYIPNMLTVIRILLIPLFIYMFFIGHYYISVLIFLLSALTDFFDGYFARKYDNFSKLGRILDPLADKLTIISVLVILCYVNIIPEVITIIILFREIFILLGGGIAYLLGIDIINPSLLGKISVFLLYVAIAAKLLNVRHVNMTLFYIVIPLNIISGINYFFTALTEYQNT